MKAKHPKISIIILNWNQWIETVKCLQTVLKNRYPNFNCIIVDNGSNDNSERNIKHWLEQQEDIIAYHLPYGAEKGDELKHFAKNERGIYEYRGTRGSQSSVKVILLQTGFNLGYSGGNNAGIRKAIEEGCDYALILNNDITVTHDFVQNMGKTALNSNASVVGGLVRDASTMNVLFAGSKLIKVLFGLPTRHRNTWKYWWKSDCVQGCAMMLRRDLLQQREKCVSHFFDSSLFLYCEEIELALWCKKHSIRSVIAGNAQVFHKPGTSSNEKSNALQFYYLTRNRLVISRRYFQSSKFLLYLLVFVPFRLFRVCMYFLSGKREIAYGILSGLVDGCKYIKGPKHVP